MDKEIREKDGMNMIMQQVLMKVIQYAQHFTDILNYKLHEVLLVMEETLDTLISQGLTDDAYEKL